MTEPLRSPGERARRVLVVDDDLEVLEAICDVLLDSGYDVEPARNGAEALRRLDRGPAPDLIILDLSMPILGGIGFLERRALRRSLSRIPVLVVTASMQPVPARFGAVAVGKPLDVDRLLALVDKLSSPPPDSSGPLPTPRPVLRSVC
jgi:CheY-like chemotaxis protein